MTYVSPTIAGADSLNGTGSVGPFNNTTFPNKTSWFKFTPVISSTVTIDTYGTTSDPDTFLFFHSGPANATTAGQLTLLAQNDDAGGVSGLNSLITYAVSAGVTYYVEAAMYSSNSSTAYILNWTGIIAQLPTASVSPYQQAAWLSALESSVTAVQALSSGTPLGSPVSATWRRSGLLLVNSATLTVTGASMTHLGLYAGSSLLAAIPWVGGTANDGQLALRLDAS